MTQFDMSVGHGHHPLPSCCCSELLMGSPVLGDMVAKDSGPECTPASLSPLCPGFPGVSSLAVRRDLGQPTPASCRTLHLPQLGLPGRPLGNPWETMAAALPLPVLGAGLGSFP